MLSGFYKPTFDPHDGGSRSQNPNEMKESNRNKTKKGQKTQRAKLLRGTNKTEKNAAKTGVIWRRLPPSCGSEMGLQGCTNISACHLPLLIGRLAAAHVLFPHHGFSFVYMAYKQQKKHKE